MEVHHYDGIVLFTGGISAVPPMLGRRMTSRENKFEIFCVGDFGEIESGCSKEVNRQEKGPEVAQPAGILQLRTLHYYPRDVSELRATSRSPLRLSAYFAFLRLRSGHAFAANF